MVWETGPKALKKVWLTYVEDVRLNLMEREISWSHRHHKLVPFNVGK